MSAPVVVFETLWANPWDGWSIAARRYARAMLLNGWDLRLKSPIGVFSDGMPEDLKRDFLPLERGTSSWDAYVFSCPLASHDRMRDVFEALRRSRRPVMFYTMFERTRIEMPLREEVASLDGSFVPCIKNQVRMGRLGLTHQCIPLPYFPDDPRIQSSFPLPRRIPEVFAWHGRWEPRKAPDRLIRAFMRAFREGECTLIIKCGPVPWTRSHYPMPRDVIEQELKLPEARANGWTDANWPKSIRVVTDTLTEGAMLELEAETDVYVSPSRGEGIDLPAFNARLAGRRLIVTESGGPEDFVHQDDIVVRATDEESIAPEYEWLWGPNPTLIDYPLSDLVHALREAHARPIARELRYPPIPNRAALVAARLQGWLEECRG